MSMTNNDEMALKLKSAAYRVKEFSGIANYSKSVGVETAFRQEATPDNILALLAERDADKKLIAQLTSERDALREGAMGDAKHSNTRAAADIYFQLIEECDIPPGGSLVEHVDNMRQRIAELEVRTVSVKLLDCDFAAVQHISGGSTDYCNGFVDGTQNAIKCFKADMAAAGINLEVGE